MSNGNAGGEMHCRVCGLRQDEAIWGVDGQSATFDICACCGCEFGYEDCSIDGIRRHREKWISSGGSWFDPTKRPVGWTIEDQLSKVPDFYFRILPGLPGTGELPVQFNVTGTGARSEGFVVEFTCASGQKWVGNFQVGGYDKSAVLTVLGRRDHAMIIAEGQAYVVDPETRALVRAFGGQITDVVCVPDRETMIFGNGLWFECVGREGLRWRTRRISWDGMMAVSLEGERLHGNALDLDNSWSPFDVNIDTGEVTGGSYPWDLPQP
ncbi:MAG: hypothetical protein JWM74_1237 [Myxococcaceae bacterium]|nr:hypothetical protein [Myxococcaceae bacterium]